MSFKFYDIHRFFFPFFLIRVQLCLRMSSFCLHSSPTPPPHVLASKIDKGSSQLPDAAVNLSLIAMWLRHAHTNVSAIFDATGASPRGPPCLTASSVASCVTGFEFNYSHRAGAFVLGSLQAFRTSAYRAKPWFQPFCHNWWRVHFCGRSKPFQWLIGQSDIARVIHFTSKDGQEFLNHRRKVAILKKICSILSSHIESLAPKYPKKYNVLWSRSPINNFKISDKKSWHRGILLISFLLIRAKAL